MKEENNIDFDLNKIESPIEEFFLNHFCKYLSSDVIFPLLGTFKSIVFI